MKNEKFVKLLIKLCWFPTIGIWFYIFNNLGTKGKRFISLYCLGIATVWFPFALEIIKSYAKVDFFYSHKDFDALVSPKYHILSQTLNFRTIGDLLFFSSVIVCIIAYLVDIYFESRDLYWGKERKQNAIISIIAFLSISLIAGFLLKSELHTILSLKVQNSKELSFDKFYTEEQKLLIYSYFISFSILKTNMLTGGIVIHVIRRAVNEFLNRNHDKIRYSLPNNKRRFAVDGDAIGVILAADRDITNMPSHKAFEYGVCDLLRKEYPQAEVVEDMKNRGELKFARGSVDQGADIIVTEHDGERMVVQCKLYNNTVGNDAVQQIYAAKNKFRAKSAMVVTNHRLTLPALELAALNGVKVLNGRDILKLSKKHKIC